MPRARLIIRYADEDSARGAANQAHSILSHEVDEVHRLRQRMERLLALDASLDDPQITEALDALSQAGFQLHAAIHQSWEKVFD